MKPLIILSIILAWMFRSCSKDTMDVVRELEGVEQTRYYDNDIFHEDNLKIYGTWKIFSTSGGFHGRGHDIQFDYLVIKPFGIYGFVRSDSILEYGRLTRAFLNYNDPRLFIILEKDEQSPSFFNDREKFVHFSGEDTLHLNSPCCDRFNYHFVRFRKTK